MKSRIILLSITVCILYIAALSIIQDTSVGYASGNNKNAKTTTTVILIRHAERDNFFNITDEGRERAKALVNTVVDMDVSAIYSPDLNRNLDTVRPVANYLKLEINLIPRISETSVDAIIGEILINNKGNVVLLVGNGSGNLRILHHRLGGKGDGPHQYGDLYIYNLSDDGSISVTKTRFGS